MVTGTDFSRQGVTRATTVAAGANRTVIVRFLPTAAAARTGALTFADSSGGTAGTTQVIALSRNCSQRSGHGQPDDAGLRAARTTIRLGCTRASS